MMDSDQAPAAVGRPNMFSEGSRVRVMRENVASILKRRRLITLGGTIDSTYNSGEGTILVYLQAAGITIKSAYGSLLALESI